MISKRTAFAINKKILILLGHYIFEASAVFPCYKSCNVTYIDFFIIKDLLHLSNSAAVDANIFEWLLNLHDQALL